jgi:MFS transporter, DHA1 family, inner membrane transport protein
MSSTETLASPSASAGRERVILLTLAAVQFTSIVDFMVIMPLGPQLARTLNLSAAHFGLVVSSYTFAAGIAGLIASMFIDRYARRTSFLTVFTGFLAGTLCCGLATSFTALLAARVLTGAFGGLLGGMAMAIVSDVFPEQRRGAAIGALMSSFALASVAGVPIGLTLGQHYGWQVPFLALAGLGVPILVVAACVMPKLDGHLRQIRHESSLERLRITFTHPNHIRAFILTVALMFSGFAVFPYLSPYLVANAGVAESNLPLNYVAGGLFALVGSPLIGRLSDRFGKLRIYRLIAPANALIVLCICLMPPLPLPFVIGAVGALMLTNAGRMVPAMALITASVEPRHRGGFLGANAAIQHFAAGLGTMVAGLIVIQPVGQPMQHYPLVGLLSAGVTLSSLWLAGRLRSAGPARLVVAEDVAHAAA